MKRIIASIIAAAMALSLSSVAFAWNAITPGTGGGTTNKPGTIIPNNPSNTVTSYDTVTIPLYLKGDVPGSIFKGDIDLTGKTLATKFPIYTYGANDSVTFNVAVVPSSNDTINIEDYKVKITSLRASSNNNQVTVSAKRNSGGWPNYNNIDHKLGAPATIKLKASNTGNDFKYDKDNNDISVDIEVSAQPVDGSGKSIGSKFETTVTLKYDEGVAYSKTQELFNDTPITLSKANGTIVKFSDVIYDKTRIRASDNVDVYFKGNYGTNKQNLRVVTDPIDAISTYFEDTNVNVYNFEFNPKFASKVLVCIDADPNATVYSYNAKTGAVTKIATKYQNNQATFETKTLGCFIVSDDEYENGNVKGSK